MYENGEGVEPDAEMAIYLYRQAANMGSMTAQVNMGDFYQEGHSAIERIATKRCTGINALRNRTILWPNWRLRKPMSKVMALVKISEAFLWYERAAQNKSQEVGMKVAEFYEKGLGG